MKLRTVLGILALAIFTLLTSGPARADLLGVSPLYPSIVFTAGSTSFDGTTLTITGAPATIRVSSLVPPRLIKPASVVGYETFDVKARLNSSCGLAGGVTGDDFVLVGEVDLDGDTVVDANGTLLTGEVAAVGSLDSGAGSFTDIFDFRVYVTGGELAYLFESNDVGIVVTSENSTFGGTCDGAFEGDAKGLAGAIAPILPADGCTPGYWKQKHHFDSWAVYSPTDSFDAVFGVTGVGGTLEDALKAKGGGLDALRRHVVASLLNAANSGVNQVAYPTTADVIAAFQSAYASGDYETQKNLFEVANEAGCPLN